MSGARQAKEEISIATVGKIRGEPKIQFESGEAMEKCEKSVCLPATAPEQRLETQHCTVGQSPKGMVYFLELAIVRVAGC